MESATRRHFFFHDEHRNNDDVGNLDSEKDECHWCQLRSFRTHRATPITVVNEVDDQVLPRNFRFIDCMILRDGVQSAEDSFRSGCSCDSSSHCQYKGCSCLEELDDDNETDNDASIDDSENYRIGHDTSDRRKIYAYHTHGPKAGLLRSKLYDSKLPLYECHRGCSCPLDCPNRVVERGRTIPLQIFRTTDRGWGVRCQEAMPKGQFVDRYVGEIITSEEADRRRDASAITKQKDVYLFALDKFTDADSPDDRLRGPPLEVDGEFMSGPTRFINHSCDPNLRIFARVGDHADKHIHDLALFAIKDISLGEELTFDYVDGMADDSDYSADNAEEMTRCRCGSANCRGYLW